MNTTAQVEKLEVVDLGNLAVCPRVVLFPAAVKHPVDRSIRSSRGQHTQMHC